MNVREFAALKQGDKIVNAFTGSTGEVTDVHDTGVYVRWTETAGPTYVPVMSTMWMQWSLPEDDCSSK